jgi:hypothetical protein
MYSLMFVVLFWVVSWQDLIFSILVKSWDELASEISARHYPQNALLSRISDNKNYLLPWEINMKKAAKLPIPVGFKIRAY